MGICTWMERETIPRHLKQRWPQNMETTAVESGHISPLYRTHNSAELIAHTAPYRCKTQHVSTFQCAQMKMIFQKRQQNLPTTDIIKAYYLQYE